SLRGGRVLGGETAELGQQARLRRRRERAARERPVRRARTLARQRAQAGSVKVAVPARHVDPLSYSR
ncbi:MAG: hypothetical protein M3292_00820, partial [Actinomycetota bacterium]|nr:hypothetical protein [Actinomycetota bacterium]